jgi:hypothetical protein
MVIVKNQKKGIEINRGTIVSKEEALARIYKVVIKGQEKMSMMSATDERKKEEILCDVVFEIAKIVLDSPDVSLLLPIDYALYSFDEINALVSRIYIENNKKVSYVV